MARKRSDFDSHNTIRAGAVCTSPAARALFLAVLAVFIAPWAGYPQSGTNPVPFIAAVQPVSVAPGGGDFTLTLYGANFVNGQSAIYWNGAALPGPTTCTAANPTGTPPTLATCTVTVRAANIVTPATANVTVVNPSTAPATGASNIVFLPVATAANTVTTTLKEFPIGTYVPSVAAGDFNGDGKIDLAVVNGCNCSQSNGTVSILLGDGAGNFVLSSTWPTDEEPNTVVVGDFNSDGNLDLAVSNSCGTNPNCNTMPTYGSVSILLGDGKGNFTKAPSISGLMLPWHMVVGDFNGDGKPDLAVVVSPPGGVAILLGDGTGNFTETAQSPIEMPGAPNALAVGDFNDDGHLDLAVTNNGNPGLVTILLGDGKGSFAIGSSFNTGVVSWSVVAADFNGDGELDLAVVSQCQSWETCNEGDGIVTTLLGDGTGQFTTAGTADGGAAPYSMTAGDFNGDGKLDLAIPTRGGVLMLLGDGTGNFTPSSSSPLWPGSVYDSLALVAADFTGDGRLDLAGIRNAQSLSVLVQAPDLTMMKTHAGNLTQGQVGATYTVAVSNTGSAQANGTVTVTDTLPTGLAATALSGTGWDCSNNSFPVTGIGTATLGCTRSDALAPGASYPAITLTANVAANAAASVTNSATVALAGQAESDTSNNSATDPTTVLTLVAGLSPTSVAFPAQLVNAPSAAQTVTLTNSGTGTLAISGVAASGDFAQTNTCGASVGAGANCTISVTFTPTAAGNRTGAVTVTDNAAGSPQTIALSGTGIAPQVSLSSTSLTFPNQSVGTSGLTQNVTLTNTGTAPLTITSVQASTGFGATNGCTASLTPGDGCTIGVLFDPNAIGNINGTLTITDNSNGVAGTTQTVALSGTGTAPAVSLSSTTVTFTAQLVNSTSAAQAVTLTNSGNLSLSIVGVTVAGTNGGDFAQTNTCGSSVAAGANCAISVTFTPTAGGSRTGTITLTDNAAGSPHTVSLTGTGEDFGVAPPSGSPTSATVTRGQTASYTLSVAPVGGLSGTISFTCTGAPSEATCTVSPTKVTASGNTATNVAVSVATTAAGLTPPRFRLPPVRPWWPGPTPLVPFVLLLTVAAIGTLVAGGRRYPQLKTIAHLAVTAVLLALLMVVASCGGGGSGGNITPPNPGTPTGSYNLTVASTLTSGSTTLTHNETLTLVVQ